MKTISYRIIALTLFSLAPIQAQEVTTITATDPEMSKNLDLEAVASVFGESKDLEDFEKRLNDPKTKLSNLDLNADGEVDYLRVMESSKNKTHLVTIQAVTGDNTYQDVAVIDVDKDGNDQVQVQVVGDVFMYGPNYIISPVYVSPPLLWVWFWGPTYRPWRSPYYWRHYPRYYQPWRPYPVSRYQNNVNVNINVNNTYNRTTVRRSTTAVNLQKQSRRDDYAAKRQDTRSTSKTGSAQTPVQDNGRARTTKKNESSSSKANPKKRPKSNARVKSNSKKTVKRQRSRGRGQ